MRSGHDVFDPDLDPPPVRVAGLDRDSVVRFQRLVVNPFLAVSVFVLIVALCRIAVEKRWPTLFGIGVALFVVDGFLVHYHCLDCGKTGWLIRYRRHSCPTVVSRWQLGDSRRLRGPGVRLQLTAWLIVLASVFVLALIFWFSH